MLSSCRVTKVFFSLIPISLYFLAYILFTLAYFSDIRGSSSLQKELTGFYRVSEILLILRKTFGEVETDPAMMIYVVYPSVSAVMRVVSRCTIIKDLASRKYHFTYPGDVIIQQDSCSV